MVGEAQLLYDASDRIAKMYFKGDMTDAEYKLLWTKSIDFGEKHQISRIIVDQREIGNVSLNARGWVVVSAFPRVKKVLPSNMVAAVLSSDKVMQRTAMQYLLKAFRALTGYQVDVFPSQQEAVDFLRSANTAGNPPA